MSDPTKYELMHSIDSRKKEMETIREAITQLEDKIKRLKEKCEELKSLNFLDEVLIKELYNGTD